MSSTSLLYDVVIPCAPKDYIKLPYCIAGLEKLNPHPETVYIVSKDRLKGDSVKSKVAYTCWIEEDEAIPIVVSDIKYHRPNWIYQQILKMTQDFTQHDYLCIDSDIVINRPLNVFNYGTLRIPNYFISSHKQNHPPYFSFMQKVFNLQKMVDFSFIADLTYFRKDVLKELIPSSEWLLSKCNEFLSDDCLIGEPEIYGNYLALTYPKSYTTIDIDVAMYGKYMPNLWTRAEVEEILAKEKNSTNHIVSIHSWT